MQLNDIFNYMFGYSDIEIEGSFAEDFLNRAIDEETEIWQIRRKDPVTLSARIRMFDQKKVMLIGEESGVEIKFISSEGLPPLLKRYRMRYGLLAGIAVILTFIMVMSAFIWTVDITGNKTISTDQLIQALDEYGLRRGCLSSDLDLSVIKSYLLRDFDNLSFVAINLSGSHANVEITERIMPPEIVDQYDPCNIVAKETGQVVLMEAYYGVPYTKVGDGVVKGQLLVGGVFDSKVVGYRMVHASAKIMARTQKNISVSKTYEYTEKIKTGTEKTRYKLDLFGAVINLFFGKEEPYDCFQKESEETCLTLGENMKLPITLIKETYFEAYEEERTYDTETLSELIKSEINELARLRLHGLQVEENKFAMTETASGITGDFNATVIEDIAAEKEIFRKE